MATTNLTVPILLKWKYIEAYMAQHDIVEVVRCKDCCNNEGSLSEPWCRIYECRKSNNGFCDEGKRKETEDE